MQQSWTRRLGSLLTESSEPPFVEGAPGWLRIMTPSGGAILLTVPSAFRCSMDVSSISYVRAFSAAARALSGAPATCGSSLGIPASSFAEMAKGGSRVSRVPTSLRTDCPAFWGRTVAANTHDPATMTKAIANRNQVFVLKLRYIPLFLLVVSSSRGKAPSPLTLQRPIHPMALTFYSRIVCFIGGVMSVSTDMIGEQKRVEGERASPEPHRGRG